MKKFCLGLTATILFIGQIPNSYGQVFYAGKQPGKATVSAAQDGNALSNNLLKTVFYHRGHRLYQISFQNLLTHKTFVFQQKHIFGVTLNDSKILTDADFVLLSKPTIKTILPNLKSPKLSDKDSGKAVAATLYNKQNKITLHWQAVLKNNSNYIQQFFSFQENDSTKHINKLSLVELSKSYNPHSSGVVDGSPILCGQQFFAIENPMSKTDSATENFISFIYRTATNSKAANDFSISTVFGVTPQHQLRRGFLYYLERERAEPYAPFLHYNSWYDLSWDTLRLHEKDCLDRIQTWCDSLTIKRGIKLDGFLWDDGWDDYNRLWHFTPTLPDGFKNMYALSQKYGASMGVWISPWGGYDEPKAKRLASVAHHIPAYETNDHGFSLAGKNYAQYFTSLAENFIKQQGVSIFKFDGMGAGVRATGAGIKYQKDIAAFLKFTQVLRTIKPDIYLSLTVGTWPSPYWLQYGNNIWRGGGDNGFTGAGNKRQRWLNYRDHDTYENIVLRNKLYPLNAVMDHGIAIAEHGAAATSENDNKDIADDIWSFFGNGTSLQEMYINPHKLNTYQWNVLAKAIKWSKAHKDVLADVHWIGGDPVKQQVYGYASWNPQHGTLMLRNPSDKAQTYKCTLSAILELPDDYNGLYKLYNVVNDKMEGVYSSNKEITFTLQPFEVKVMNVEKK